VTYNQALKKLQFVRIAGRERELAQGLPLDPLRVEYTNTTSIAFSRGRRNGLRGGLILPAALLASDVFGLVKRQPVQALTVRQSNDRRYNRGYR
jgi:hypothetical protein